MDYPWILMEIHVYPCISIDINGYLLLRCTIHGSHHHGFHGTIKYPWSPWISMSIPCIFMDIHGYLLLPCTIHGYHHHGLHGTAECLWNPWIPDRNPCISWINMGIHCYHTQSMAVITMVYTVSRNVYGIHGYQ
jgi:hypothetical protein